MVQQPEAKPGRAIASLPWTIANSALQLFSKVAILVVLSRVLTPAEFGQFYIGMAIVIIVGTLAVVGIPTNMIYLEKVDRPTVAAAFWLGLATSVTAGALVWLFGWIYFDGPDDGTSYGIAVASACYLPIFVALGILEALSRRSFKFKMLAMAELTATVLGSFLVALALALVGWGVWALVAGQAVYGLVMGAILVRSNEALVSFRTRAPYFRQVARAGAAITIAEFANFATINGMRPIVGLEMGAAMAGLWTRFYNVISIQLVSLVEPFNKLVLPALSRQRGEQTRMEANLRVLVETVTLITLPVALITALVAPFAVPLAFGPEWNGVILPLQIGAVSLFFRGIEKVLLSAARAIGRMWPRAVVQIVQFFLVMACLYATMPLGLAAVSAGFVVAQSIGLALTMVVIARVADARLGSLLRGFLPGVCLSTAALAAAVIVAQSADVPLSGWEPILAAVVCLAVGGLVLVSLRRRLLAPPLADLIDGVVGVLRRRVSAAAAE